jgi:hypothetical protein
MNGTKCSWVHDWFKAPALCLVALGTNLTKAEILTLEDADFQLQNKDFDMSPRRLFQSSSIGPLSGDDIPNPTDANVHSTNRHGKTIRRLPSALTVDHPHKWETARNVKAIVKNVRPVLYLGYGRIITLDSGDYPNQKIYKITVCDFPSCTCDDFVTMSSGMLGRRKVWVNCKHLYYVYRFYCKANAKDDKFIHAPNLSFNELQYLL